MNRKAYTSQPFEATPLAEGGNCCSLPLMPSNKSEDVKKTLNQYNLLGQKPEFQPGDPVIFIPENVEYDFGHYLKIPGMCVLYEKGTYEAGAIETSFTCKLVNIRKTFKDDNK